MSDLNLWKSKVTELIEKHFGDFNDISSDADVIGCAAKKNLTFEAAYKKLEEKDNGLIYGLVEPACRFRSHDRATRKFGKPDFDGTLAFFGTNNAGTALNEEITQAITIEGISIAYAPRNVFKLFSVDSRERLYLSFTFKELAEHGYTISDGKVSLNARTSISGFDDRTVRAHPRLRNFLPDIVKLYNENKDLYEEALDEYVEDE